MSQPFSKNRALNKALKASEAEAQRVYESMSEEEREAAEIELRKEDNQR